MASPDELWLVDFGEPFPDEPAFHRPAIVLGPPITFGENFPYRIVAPLTTTDRGLDLHVAIEPGVHNGLDRQSYIQCELIRSVNARRLVHRLGVADAVTVVTVRDVIAVLLDH